MKMKQVIRAAFFVLLSLPKTIWFNFRVLKFRDAVHLPILMGYNMKLLRVAQGSVRFKDGFRMRPFTVRFGFTGTEVIPAGRGIVRIESGSCCFGNEDRFAAGSVLDVNGGDLTFGDAMCANRNVFISCSKRITFGDDVFIGWNVTVRDSDGHTVICRGTRREACKEVVVGSHVWLCAESSLLKGVQVGDGSVVGYKAVVTKAFPEANLLLGGFPAKVLQTDTTWEKEAGENEAEE